MCYCFKSVKAPEILKQDGGNKRLRWQNFGKVESKFRPSLNSNFGLEQCFQKNLLLNKETKIMFLQKWEGLNSLERVHQKKIILVYQAQVLVSFIRYPTGQRTRMCTMGTMYSPIVGLPVFMSVLKGGMPETFRDPFMVFVSPTLTKTHPFFSRHSDWRVETLIMFNLQL